MYFGTLARLLLVLALVTSVAAAQADTLYWVFLNKGGNKTPLEKDEAERLQAAHIGNLKALGTQGKALTAGPLGENGTIRGIVVLTVKTPQEVQDCFRADPFVQNDYLVVEAYPWLAERKQFHKPNEPFKIAQYTLGIVKKGSNWPLPSGQSMIKTIDALLASLRKSLRTHDLAVSGPLREAKDLVGILLFRTPDQGKVRQALDNDPAIKDGRIVVELHSQWLGEGTFGK